MAKKVLEPLRFRDAWDIFDQIMVSETLIPLGLFYRSGKREFTQAFFDSNNRQ
jgi:hypothetical protein